MAHVKPNKETLSPRTVAQLQNLFGTPSHAQQCLGLIGVISYQVFYRAIRGGAISNADGHIITAALDRWRTLFLTEAWHFSHVFELPTYREDDDNWRDLKPQINEWRAALNN